MTVPFLIAVPTPSVTARSRRSRDSGIASTATTFIAHPPLPSTRGPVFAAVHRVARRRQHTRRNSRAKHPAPRGAPPHSSGRLHCRTPARPTSTSRGAGPVKAAVYYGARHIRVEDIPRPAPGADEILV